MSGAKSQKLAILDHLNTQFGETLESSIETRLSSASTLIFRLLDFFNFPPDFESFLCTVEYKNDFLIDLLDFSVLCLILSRFPIFFCFSIFGCFSGIAAGYSAVVMISLVSN
jgi:hypothetical protein